MHGIFCGGVTPATDYACTYLGRMGLPVTKSHEADQLLMDVPAFRPDGCLRDGTKLPSLPEFLPCAERIWGGNLNHPVLRGYEQVDFLQDEGYLAENAYITAECVLDVVLPRYMGLLRGCPVLIVGWGRIGKCLARLLRALDADVTVTARGERVQRMLQAMGYAVLETDHPDVSFSRYRILINTVPATVIPREQMCRFRPDCLKIELASTPGLFGDDVIPARGLPGIYRPEASGRLIAMTMLGYLKKEGTL